MAPIPCLLDTDFANDADDLFDLGTLLQLHKNGVYQLLGIGALQSHDNAPGAIDVINTHMGLTIPIGCWKGTSFTSTDKYAEFLYDKYSHPNTGLASTVQDMLTLYRTVLAARSAKDVWIIANGPAHGIDQLLSSPADSISGYTGLELINRYVAGLMWVAGEPILLGTGGDHTATKGTEWRNAGAFSDSAAPEANMSAQPAAANRISTGWPMGTRQLLVPIHLGYQIYAGTAIDSTLPATCPIRDGYDNWVTLTPTWTATWGRQAWTPVGLDCLTNSGEWGTIPGNIAVNAATGASTYTFSRTGRDEILYRKVPNATFVSEFDTVLYQHGT